MQNIKDTKTNDDIDVSSLVNKVCGLIFSFDDEQLYGTLSDVIDQYWGHTPREIISCVRYDLFEKYCQNYVKIFPVTFGINHANITIFSRVLNLLIITPRKHETTTLQKHKIIKNQK